MRSPDLAEDYIRRAEVRLRALDVLLQGGSWADVVRESQEIVELTLKALLRASGVDPPRVHDVSGVLLSERARMPEGVRPEIDTLAEASRQLRRDRELAFYGAEDLTPSGFYTEQDARQARATARRTVEVVKPHVRLRATEPRQVREIDIAAPAEKVWGALIDPKQQHRADWTLQYSDLEPGSKYELRDTGGRPVIAGEAIEVDPPHRLVTTRRHPWSDAEGAAKPSRVAYQITPTPQGSKLTVVHDGFESEESPVYKAAKEEWPHVLEALKALVEDRHDALAEALSRQQRTTARRDHEQGEAANPL